MIIDADSHFYPIDVFDKLPYTEWVAQYRADRIKVSLDKHWQLVYNTIRDTSWPECPPFLDFRTLPEAIRLELRDRHDLNTMHVSTDGCELRVNRESCFYSDIETHKHSLIEIKVDRQLLNAQGPIANVNQVIDKKFLEDITLTYNQYFLNICKDNTEFDATAWIPMVHSDSDQRELARIVDLSYFGLNVGESAKWNCPEVLALFKVCASKKFPVYMHLSGPGRSAYPNSTKVDSNMLAIMKSTWPSIDDIWKFGIIDLIVSKMFDTIPDLRIVVAERGIKWIPELRNFMLEQGFEDPLPYFRKNFWFTIEVEEENFVNVAKMVGWDRLLFATDYPHNDIGGLGRLSDVTNLNILLETGQITQQEFEEVSYKNYQFLKSRS